VEILSLKTIDILQRVLHAIPRYVFQVILATLCSTFFGILLIVPALSVLNHLGIGEDSAAANILSVFLLASAAVLVAVLYKWRAKRPPSRWVWIPPLLWLALLVREDFTSVTHQVVPWYYGTATRYLWDNFVGSDCSGTECIGELFGTWPFLASVAYTLAAIVLRRRISKSEQTSQIIL
jgi:hypothetical protein